MSSRESPRTNISPSPGCVAASMASARRATRSSVSAALKQISDAPGRHLADAVAGDDERPGMRPAAPLRPPAPAPCKGSGRRGCDAGASLGSLARNRADPAAKQFGRMRKQARRFRRVARQGEHVRMLPALPRAQDRQCHDCRLVREEHGDGDRHRHDAEAGARNDHRSRRGGIQPIVDGKQDAEEAGRHRGEQNGRLRASGEIGKSRRPQRPTAAERHPPPRLRPRPSSRAGTTAPTGSGRSGTARRRRRNSRSARGTHRRAHRASD